MLIESASTVDPNKPQLSKEEKEKILNEKIEAMRKFKAEEEKRIAEEQEANRIRAQKDMLIAKRKMEESQAKIALEQQQREKREFMDAKKEMLRKLKADKRARGMEVSDSDEEDGGGKKVKKGIETVKEGIKIVETLYTEERQPGIAKTCFKTFHTICKNILKDPSEDKFRRLNLTNEKIQQRISKIHGGLMMLKGVGFKVVDHGDGLHMPAEEVDTELLDLAMTRVGAKL